MGAGPVECKPPVHSISHDRKADDKVRTAGWRAAKDRRRQTKGKVEPCQPIGRMTP